MKSQLRIALALLVSMFSIGMTQPAFAAWSWSSAGIWSSSVADCQYFRRGDLHECLRRCQRAKWLGRWNRKRPGYCRSGRMGAHGFGIGPRQYLRPRFHHLYHRTDWRQSFFPVNDKQNSLSFLRDTSSSRGCGKSGNPAGCAGFPGAVGSEGNRLLVFLAFHGPVFFHSSPAAAFYVFVLEKKLIIS